jgi:AAA domain
MGQRDGHVSGGAAPPTRSPDVPALAPMRTWEAVFPALSPTQQQQALDLSRSQGYVIADQVSPMSPAPDRSRTVLTHAMSGRLSPSRLVDPINPYDANLDVAQRDAVARAMQTDDLFVILGPAGTGKTRVAIEIVRQVVEAGGRALFLSSEPAALDTQLPGLAAMSALAVVRRLVPGERVDGLPTEIAALTPAGREMAVRDTLVRQSAESLVAAEARFSKAADMVHAWDELLVVRERLATRAAERATLIAKQSALSADVATETQATNEPVLYFVQRHRGAVAARARKSAVFDGAAAELRAARSEAEERNRTAESACRDLRPKAAALESGRWYTTTFWRARFDHTLAAKLAEAEGRLAVAKAALDELAVREQKLAADRRLADEELAAERARLIDGEVARRTAELASRTAEIDLFVSTDTDRQTALMKSLGEAADNATTIAVEHEVARQDLALARDWSRQVETNIDELVREACSSVNVVAGPIAGIATDNDLAAVGPFDLLVIDDAHKLGEVDFHAAARLARRWVLIGEPTHLLTGRARNTRPELFTRLAAALRHEVWGHEGDRLVCRLSPVRVSDRRRLECEPVADAPDIELRLFTPPNGDPTLAEVAFPVGHSPTAAREYLFRELGEVTCCPRLRTANWSTNPDGHTLRFGPADPSATLAQSGNGVREELVALETRAIHFTTDWSLEQAKAWAAEHVGRRDSGRVSSLARPYRACPGLARWLNRAFATGFVVAPTGDAEPHVEFLAVPDTDPRRRREPARPGRVGGAGYEIDLSDSRQRTGLPADFADLPTTGCVNIPEAQALTRYLEPLAGSRVVITSPFPTQVMVLRRLVARSPRLAAVRVIDVADAARTECDLLAVSLTRSHVARAVTFGDSPATLAGLLGRAAKKLLFAGDPGTLARRLQWDGPVDHLDAAEAAREWAWVAALADCPRVVAPRPRPSPPESVRA